MLALHNVELFGNWKPQLKKQKSPLYFVDEDCLLFPAAQNWNNHAETISTATSSYILN